MSEYEYYEFQAIDRPLGTNEMEELRSYSTRARITPTSFINDYSWGGFRGDVNLWMAKYFDAFLYYANWGTHVLKLRLPARLLDAPTAMGYCTGGSAAVVEASDKLIVIFESDDEDGGQWVEDEVHLSSLISVRAELARGDLRALYLGWLLRAQFGELDDEDLEPSVPPGLGQLSASLEALVDFLGINGDLLQAAAEQSSPPPDVEIDRDEVHTWIRDLATREKDDLITSLVMNAHSTPVAELLHRFLKQRGNGERGRATTARTVGELIRAAGAHATRRNRLEAESRAPQGESATRTRGRDRSGHAPR